ncbi:MAG: type I-B CRISPR-associated protein Cas5b [bacterium]
MRVLVFDIWGDYAHFRKFYTTTSPLTFSFPPPSTIAGILGAIYGTTKETNQYLKLFVTDEVGIGVQIINSVKKIRMGLNLIDTTEDKHWRPKVRTQVRTEFVKDPRYRIFFYHPDTSISNAISNSLKEHKAVYTVSLGLSELLANFCYVGEYQATHHTNPPQAVEILTPIVEENIVPRGVEIESGKRYIKELMPIKMNSDRIVEQYAEVIFQPDGKPIKARVKNYYQLENGENISLFWDLLSPRDTS